MITTPRGIAIPLPLDHSFCLMSRLYPKIKPYTVLATAAGFYKMHGAVGCVTGLVCFFLRLPTWQIAAITFVATVIGYFMAVFAIYPPGLLRVARAYSLLTGYGIILVGLSVVGVMTVGVVGAGAFWGARLLAELVTMAHVNLMGRKFLPIVNPEGYAIAKQAGIFGAPDGFAVRCFGNAYATYATKLGVPLQAVATQSELDDDAWRTVLKEFVDEWPQIVRRFQVTDDEWQQALQGR